MILAHTVMDTLEILCLSRSATVDTTMLAHVFKLINKDIYKYGQAKDLLTNCYWLSFTSILRPCLVDKSVVKDDNPRISPCPFNETEIKKIKKII